MNFITFANPIQNLSDALPDILVAIIFLLLGFVIATLVKSWVVKALSKDSIKAKLASKDGGEAEGKKMVNALGSLAFLIVFLLFLPAVFTRLHLTGVSEPIIAFVQSIVGYIPRLIAAGILVYIGFFVAKLIKDLVANLLERFGADKLQEKYLASNQGQKLSAIIANIVYAFVVIPVVIAALDILGLEAVSKPAVEVLRQVLQYIPKVFIAVVIIYIGVFIANLISSILKSLLLGVNVDKFASKLGAKESFKLSDLLVLIVKVVLIMVFAVEAINVLDLSVLTTIGGALIAYLPRLISAIIIMVAALFLGNFVQNKLLKKDSKYKLLGFFFKVLILVVAVFMTLAQLGFAKNIVEYAFIIMFAAVAVAFAIAFGTGGKDFAKKRLEELDNKIEEKKDE